MPPRASPIFSAIRRFLPVLALVLMTALLQWFAVRTIVGQRIDDAAMNGIRETAVWWRPVALAALEMVSLPVIAMIFGLSLLATGLQRRFSALLQIATVVVGANISVQLVKHELIERPLLVDSIVATPNSFPSGHVALIATAVFALSMAAPRSMRPSVGVILGAWGALAALGTVAAGWHRPSDVVGSVMLTGVWILAASNAATHVAFR